MVEVAPVFAAAFGRIGVDDDVPIRANLVGGLPQGVEEHPFQVQRPGGESPEQFLAGTLVEAGLDGQGQERAVLLGVTQAFLELPGLGHFRWHIAGRKFGVGVLDVVRPMVEYRGKVLDTSVILSTFRAVLT